MRHCWPGLSGMRTCRTARVSRTIDATQRIVAIVFPRSGHCRGLRIAAIAIDIGSIRAVAIRMSTGLARLPARTPRGRARTVVLAHHFLRMLAASLLIRR